MRYLMMLKADPANRIAPTPELYAAMGELTEESTKSGMLVDTGAVQASESGTTLKLKGGKITVADGPLTGENELAGGYAIVKVGSKEEAVAMSR